MLTQQNLGAETKAIFLKVKLQKPLLNWFSGWMIVKCKKFIFIDFFLICAASSIFWLFLL